MPDRPLSKLQRLAGEALSHLVLPAAMLVALAGLATAEAPDPGHRPSAAHVAAPEASAVAVDPSAPGAEPVAFDALAVAGAATGTATGPLVDCGRAADTCTEARGAVCLIERGGSDIARKLVRCRAGGGVAAVIFNDRPGYVRASAGSAPTRMPAVTVPAAAGRALLERVGDTVTVATSRRG